MTLCLCYFSFSLSKQSTQVRVRKEKVRVGEVVFFGKPVLSYSTYHFRRNGYSNNNCFFVNFSIHIFIMNMSICTETETETTQFGATWSIIRYLTWHLFHMLMNAVLRFILVLLLQYCTCASQMQPY